MSEKQTMLLRTAIQLISEEGVGVATAKIARTAGVSNGTLFNYFATKQILFETVYLHIKTKMAQDILVPADKHSSLDQFLLAIWMSFSAWCIHNPIELEALNTLKSSQLLGDTVTGEGERIWARVFSRLEQGMTDKVITTAPVGLITASIQGVVQSVATYAVRHKLPDPMVEKLTKRSFDLFWKGITL